MWAPVRVLSSPNLHAKVIVTDRRAVIGSANASQNSTVVDEAVIITDDPDLLAAAGKFIDDIDEITEVDTSFLDNPNAEWAKGRGAHHSRGDRPDPDRTRLPSLTGDPDVRLADRRVRPQRVRATRMDDATAAPAPRRRTDRKVPARMVPPRRARPPETG